MGYGERTWESQSSKINLFGFKCVCVCLCENYRRPKTKSIAFLIKSMLSDGFFGGLSDGLVKSASVA